MSTWLLPRLERALRRLVAHPSVSTIEVWAPGGRLCHLAGRAPAGKVHVHRDLGGGSELRVTGVTPDFPTAEVEDAAEWVSDVLKAFALPSGPPGLTPELAIRWESVVRANADAVIVVRRDGMVEFANTVALREFPTIEVVGMQLADENEWRLDENGHVLSPEDSPTLRTFLTGESQEQVIGFKHGDRPPSWYSIRTAFFDETRTRVLATLTDITAIKNAEDEARAGEAMLRSTFATLADGILVMDATFRILDANPAAEDILGLPLEVLRNPVQQPITQVLRQDGTPLPLDEWPAYRAIRHGERVRGLLLELRRLDGGWRWLLMNAEPVAGHPRAIVSFTDVTALQSARTEAEAASRRWRALMDNLDEGVVLFDPAGLVEDLNHAAEGILGLQRASLRDGPRALESTLRVVDEHGQPLAERPCEACRRTGQPVTGVITGMVRPDGVRWYVNSAVPLPEGRVLLSLVDFTEIRNARVDLERRKDEFVSTLSHELRTPLTSLDGALALIKAGVGGGMPPQGAELLSLARRSAGRLIRLVNDVLDLERIAAGGITIRSGRHALREVAQQAVEAATPLAQGRRVELRLGELPEVVMLTDADRVAQVLGNFLANAIQFFTEGQAVEVSGRLAGRFVRIEVRDRGPGVPDGFVPRLFSRFAQAPGASGRGGAGLGLSICRAVAGALGGEVGYEHATGGGALFWLVLPRLVP